MDYNAGPFEPERDGIQLMPLTLSLFSMKSPRGSHSTYPEYFDPRRVPPLLKGQERAQVRSPLPQAQSARGVREASVMPHVRSITDAPLNENEPVQNEL